MKLPRLKIPTRELPLVALGIAAVLASAILKQPLIQYLLVAMFFGVLSKETRWTFWTMNFLIAAFNAFRLLLSTDRETVVLDSIFRVSAGIAERLVRDRNASILAPAKGALVGLGNNPILRNPVVITVISIVMIVVGVVIWAFSVVVMVVFIAMMLPVIGHLTLMLYIFHRDEVVSMMEYFIANESVPEYMGRLIAPYMVQGIAIQMLLMAAILPLVFYRILRRIGFYKRFPGIQS